MLQKCVCKTNGINQSATLVKSETDGDYDSPQHDDDQLATNIIHDTSNIDQKDASESASLSCENSTSEDWVFSIQFFLIIPKVYYKKF